MNVSTSAILTVGTSVFAMLIVFAPRSVSAAYFSIFGGLQ